MKTTETQISRRRTAWLQRYLFDQARHGSEIEHLAPSKAPHRDEFRRIGHGCGEQPELHDERYHMLQVTEPMVSASIQMPTPREGRIRSPAEGMASRALGAGDNGPCNANNASASDHGPLYVDQAHRGLAGGDDETGIDLPDLLRASSMSCRPSSTK